MASITTHPVRSSPPPLQTENAVPPSGPQQAAARPGDAGAVDPNVSDTSPTARVPWKDQVVAFAKKTRGTIFRKPTLKEHGDQILAGEASAREPTRKDLSE